MPPSAMHPVHLSAALLLSIALLPLNLGHSLAQAPESTPTATSSPPTDRTEPQFSFQDICAAEDSIVANTAAQLAKMGQFDRALQLAETIKSPIARPLLLVYITDQLAKVGQFDRAKTVAQSLQENIEPAGLSPALFLSPFGDDFRQQAYMVLSFRLAAAGRSEEALNLAKQVKEVTIRPALLFAIAAQLDKQGKTSQADALLQEVTQLLKNPSGFVTEAMMDSATDRILQQGSVEPVLKLVNLLKDLQRNTPKRPDTFNFLDQIIEGIEFKAIQKLIDLGRYEEAFEITEKLADQGVGRINKIVLRFRLATEVSKAGQIDFALRINQRMPDEQDRFLSLRNIIIALAEQQNFERALELTEGITPTDAKAYVIRPIVYRLWKAGQPDRALQIVNQLSEPDLVADGLTSLAEAAIEMGQTDRAAELLRDATKRLQETSQPATLPEEAQVLSDIAISWAKLGQYSQALKVIQLVGPSGVKDDALPKIILEMVKGKRYDQATQVARTIKNQRKQTGTLVQITAQLIANEEYDRALKLIDQFSDQLRLESPEQFSNMTRIILGQTLKSSLFATTALTIAERGQFDRALQVTEKITDDFTKVMTIGMMAVRLYDTGKPTEGDRLLDQARQIARTVKPPARPNSKRPVPVCPSF